MKIFILDGSRFTSKQEAHEYIQRTLGFPSYYGKNLDALDDCLSELSRDVGVIMTGADVARSALGGYADGILEDFEDVLGVKGRFMKI